jgi:hypothetical protein
MNMKSTISPSRVDRTPVPLMHGLESMTMRTYGKEKFDREKFLAPVNSGWIKPDKGGLWTSPVRLDEETGTFTTGWLEWCLSEDFRPETLKTYFEFKLDPQSRIAKIDGVEDLNNLMSEHMDRSQMTLERMWRQVLDFEAMAYHFDAIYLTDKGQWDTRFSDPGLYGWDCESVLILNPEIVIV